MAEISVFRLRLQQTTNFKGVTSLPQNPNLGLGSSKKSFLMKKQFKLIFNGDNLLQGTSSLVRPSKEIFQGKEVKEYIVQDIGESVPQNTLKTRYLDQKGYFHSVAFLLNRKVGKNISM